MNVSKKKRVLDFVTRSTKNGYYTSVEDACRACRIRKDATIKWIKALARDGKIKLYEDGLYYDPRLPCGSLGPRPGGWPEAKGEWPKELSYAGQDLDIPPGKRLRLRTFCSGL